MSTEQDGSKGHALALRFAQGIDRYLQDSQQAGILRPRQRPVFEDFRDALAQGHSRLCMEYPTGMGKTVLFVEASKALLATPGDPKPKILVVTPTKDLVHQTLGLRGDRGYGKFAPELNVGTLFSDTPKSKRRDEVLEENDVIITTYRSFNIMGTKFLYRDMTPKEREELSETLGINVFWKTMPSDISLLSKFNVFIFDEAHHVYGGDTSRLVERLPESSLAIALSATLDADQDRRITKYFPVKFHTLGLSEAIWMGSLAPVVGMGIKSGIRIKGSNLYTESGEFIDNRLRYLAVDEGRNKLIRNAAKVMAGRGLGVLISCMAGNEAWQVRHLAETMMLEDGVKAIAVHSGINAKDRREIYKRFDTGEIDVLTYVGVLGEGWDSPRAKGLINGRNTRSVIVAKQRLGRITRPDGIAFALDILDDYEDQNPAITIADVLDEGDIPMGHIIGTVEDRTQIDEMISALLEVAPLTEVLSNRYKAYLELIATLPELQEGVIYSEGPRPKIEWVVPSRINRSYVGVTDEIIARLEELTGITLERKRAKQDRVIRTVYKFGEAFRLLDGMASVDPNKFFIDNEGKKRISATGLVLLFSKRYPKVSQDVMGEVLESIEEDLDWIPGSYLASPPNKYYRQYRVIKMYESNQQTIDKVNTVLAEYFASDGPKT